MDVERVISELTPAEKVTLLAGKSLWQNEAIERLGIPSITMTDGPHGVRLGGFDPETTAPATAFPVEAAIAATWDPALIEEAGRAMAEECQFYDVNDLRSLTRDSTSSSSSAMRSPSSLGNTQELLMPVRPRRDLRVPQDDPENGSSG